MTDSGPTTTGSIVAKIKGDHDQWTLSYREVKAQAAELSRLSPTIRLDMDVASALAKIESVRAAAASLGGAQMSVSPSAGSVAPAAGSAGKVDAVAAAERRLAAAMSAADTAYARAELAQMRLNETREKGITEGSRLAAAELAAAEAVKRLDAANEKATLSEAGLAAAQEKAAKTALEKAAAEGVAAKTTIQANDANKTSASRMGLITSAVALLLPLLAPVAAGAIGLAGAFTLMGVTGILAIIGINREMKDGTAVGQAYSAGIGSLKTNMSALATTSAVNMLSSFQRVVRETNDEMPFLTQQVGTFSGLLGRTGGNFFSGALTGLRALNPLLLTAGVYVEALSVGFDRWTRNGGLERFGGYALSVFPQVVDVLGALATMVMHILEALAPLGAIGMSVLTGIANAINAIPVELLSQLIVTITWGTLAFKAWGFVAPMLAGIATSMGAVGTAATIATGPIGWIVAGVAALAGIFAVMAASGTGATQAIQNYTAAVQNDTGAIGENVRMKAAQQLLDSGAYDAATKLGISTKLVTEATLGDTAAKKKLAAATKEASGNGDNLRDTAKRTGLSLTEVALASETVTNAVRDQSGGIRGAVKDYETLQDALGKTTNATAYQKNAIETAAAAAGVSTAAYQAATAAQGDAKAQTEQTTAAMYLQSDAAGLLRQQMDLLNGKTLDAEQAQNQFDSQLANMADHMDAAGKEVDRANALLDGNTAAAVKNRGELINLTEAAQNNAQAFRDNGGSAEETKQKLIDMKDQILQNAIAHGEDAAQVQAYLDKIFQIPESIPPTKIEVDTAHARAQIDLFIANVNSRVASIQVRATMPDLNGAVSGSGRPGVAMGGTIRGLALGGSGGSVFGSGTAGSDTAGLFRLAHGEEVISNVFGQADRSRSLLKAINAGFTPTHSNAGTVATSPGDVTTVNGKGKETVHKHYWTVYTNNPDDLFQQFTMRTNAGGAV